MISLPKLNLPAIAPRAILSRKRLPGSSLLGISLDGHRLEAVVVRRSGDSFHAQNAFGASLELNLLTNDPELVGREIRNHLDKAGIDERHCAVCLPLDWALTLHIPVPELPAEDVDAFLNTEAERGFPFAQETLSIGSSRCRAPNGALLATLIAVPKEHLTTLQKILKAAQLKPFSFSLGMPALQPVSGSAGEGLAALGLSENNVELQVTCGGGIAALRALEGAMEQDGMHKVPYADVVARDLRITLGQLPSELRDTVRKLKVFGNREYFERFAEDLAARAKLMGLEMELVRAYNETQFGMPMPADAVVSPALSLAARLLAGQALEFEFLPPKISAWQQFNKRYSSGKLAWAGGAAGVIALVVLLAFLFQQWQLSRWGAKWAAIKPRVTELDSMQQQIRRFRPWFDESFRTLSILQRLTEAFPEDGSVSAKRVVIKDPATVTCSGIARDIPSLLKVRDQLRATKEVADVQLPQMQGKAPVQFSLQFRWNQRGNP
jgi:hypothetical protein